MSFEFNPADDNPDPHDECRHHIQEQAAKIRDLQEQVEHLESYKLAFDVWHEKTEWVQQKSDWEFPALGLHRADVMRLEIERLTKLLEQTKGGE